MKWEFYKSCATGETCDKGECKSGQICTPDAKQCDGNNVQKCSSDGMKWEFYKSCATGETCDKGECTAVEPGLFYVSVSADDCSWQDSGVSVSVGDALTISANGIVQTWASGDWKQFEYRTPLGNYNDSANDAALKAPGLYRTGLIGKIGNVSTPFAVGVGTLVHASTSGTLYFAINETPGGCADNDGSWDVVVVKNAFSWSNAKIDTVNADDCSWQDSGVSVSVGDALTISANGIVQTWASGDWKQFEYRTPLGNYNDSANDAALKAPGLYRTGLIGKIGNVGTPFAVGVGTLVHASTSGTLYFAINETPGGCADNDGSWDVVILQ